MLPIDAAVEIATSGRVTFDRDGSLAARGEVNRELLDSLLSHPYFALQPPKSTGRELFGRPFVERLVAVVEPEGDGDWLDLLATLTELTARSIADAYERWLIPRGVDEVVVTGGGARNPTLLARIRTLLEPLPVSDGAVLGEGAEAKEAIAFAVLAWAHLMRIPRKRTRRDGRCGSPNSWFIYARSDTMNTWSNSAAGPLLEHTAAIKYLGVAVRAAAPGAVVLLGLTALAACSGRSHDAAPPTPFYREVRGILDSSQPSPEYLRGRSRLEAMGPELDSILFGLATDSSASVASRANALVLLADRQSPAALDLFRSVLLTEDEELLRSAAVVGLQRFAGSEAAQEAIRVAVKDPSRRVRLNALQALNVQDTWTIRALLASEKDSEVRKVATQLLALAESRGAPLTPDATGVYRTTALDDEPRIVLRPSERDAVGEVATGTLSIEFPDGRDLVLAKGVEVIGDVLPAFFSPDGTAVVFEVARGIRVYDIRRNETRFVGAGIAPRPLPFTESFVFLREIANAAGDTLGAAVQRYRVLSAPFAGGEPTSLGELSALVRSVGDSRYPVQTLVVGEVSEGFVLRSEGISTFLLPNPFEREQRARDEIVPSRTGTRGAESSIARK